MSPARQRGAGDIRPPRLRAAGIRAYSRAESKRAQVRQIRQTPFRGQAPSSPRPPKRLAFLRKWEDGRVATTSLDFIMGGSSTQPDPLASGGGRLWASAPVRCLSPHSAGHTSCRPRDTPVVRDVRCSVCLRRRPTTIGCRWPAGHAGLSGALRTVEPLPRWEVTAALPDTRCAPGSREDDGQDYAGGWKGVGRFRRTVFIIKQNQCVGW